MFYLLTKNIKYSERRKKSFYTTFFSVLFYFNSIVYSSFLHNHLRIKSRIFSILFLFQHFITKGLHSFICDFVKVKACDYYKKKKYNFEFVFYFPFIPTKCMYTKFLCKISKTIEKCLWDVLNTIFFLFLLFSVSVLYVMSFLLYSQIKAIT